MIGFVVDLLEQLGLAAVDLARRTIRTVAFYDNKTGELLCWYDAGPGIILENGDSLVLDFGGQSFAATENGQSFSIDTDDLKFELLP